MPYGGRGLFLGVHKATREAASVLPGERVQVVGAASVAEAKRPETRERRLAAAMARLRSQ